MTANKEIAEVVISFIVIGRNEIKNIEKCISSILTCAAENSQIIPSWEIIYVDSNSTDGTVEFVGKFKEVKAISLKGKCNAALGRNVGARYATGKTLFFIDGDMEIHPYFFKHIFNSAGELIHPYISGQFVNYYYNNEGKVTDTEPYIKNLSADRYEYSSGGLFFLENKLWNELGGMRTQFKTGEDLDLGLRLAKRGIYLLRKKETLANHHTVPYHSMDRMWKDIPKGITMYSRGMLYRYHLLNKYMYKRIIKSDPTACILAAGIFGSIVFQSVIPLLAYLILCGGLIGFMFRKNAIWKMINRLIYQYVRDILTLLSFLFLHPRPLHNSTAKIVNHNSSVSE